MSPSPPMLRRCSGCARIAKPCASDSPRMSSFGPISVVRLPKNAGIQSHGRRFSSCTPHQNHAFRPGIDKCCHKPDRRFSEPIVPGEEEWYCMHTPPTDETGGRRQTAAGPRIGRFLHTIRVGSTGREPGLYLPCGLIATSEKRNS